MLTHFFDSPAVRNQILALLRDAVESGADTVVFYLVVVRYPNGMHLPTRFTVTGDNALVTPTPAERLANAVEILPTLRIGGRFEIRTTPSAL